MRSLILLVALMVAFTQTAGAGAKTDVEQHHELAQAARSAFGRSDFQELNERTRSYRIKKPRSASGLWLLTFYYAGLEQAIHVERRQQENPDRMYANLEKQTARWARDFPDSPAAHIVHARVLINHAWAYRGNGLAGTVDPKNWAPFLAYIAKARRYLEAHKQVAAVDPRWYEVMLIVAKAQNWERPEFERLLAEALDREPQFYQTYFSALNYLLPQWHGSVVEIESFAQAAVKRTAATDGRGLYARIYWYASQAQFNNRLFEDSLIDWPHMRDGFEDVIKRYPDAWNLNNYAKFACLAEDKRKAHELMDRIGTDIVPEAWTPASLLAYCIQSVTRSDDDHRSAGRDVFEQFATR